MIYNTLSFFTPRRCAGRVPSLALVATIGAVFLTGCQALDTPQPQPQPSPQPEPTPSPTPAPLPDVDTNSQPQVEPRLFIANFLGDGVVSYANPSTVNGNIAPDTNLQGAQTQLFRPLDVVVNSAGQLLAANVTGNSITTYNDAATANGNLAPDGLVQGAATQLLAPVSLAFNAGENLLFVANLNGTDEIQVFANTTQPALNGNLAPIRTISNTRLSNIFAPGINFGANDDLYVANRGKAEVLVFANASTLNGTVDATRIITSSVFVDIDDVFIDGDDNMFVLDFTGFVYTFRNASTLNGEVAPDFTLQVPPALALTGIVVSSNDTGYIVDINNNAVYSYDNISTLNGALVPDRTIQGANTLFNSPSRAFLVE